MFEFISHSCVSILNDKWHACVFFAWTDFIFGKFKMTSVERVNEYSTMNGENLKTAILKPFDAWPERGRIAFENVSFAYDKHLPNILKNVSFTINPKEKVGIVGRTGSGKSTVFQALIRMAEQSGSISIDGIDIKNLSLDYLRNKISAIPVSNFILIVRKVHITY
jgi:ABC-type multidrug transport system fused ATPase/permease subunit